MLEYNKSIDDYINTVKQGIKWKRARDIATRELSDHINDLYDSFLADGIEENKAIEMSIREMGSADIGDPNKFCVKPNKALPIRQD